MIEKIANFDELGKFIKDSGINYREAIVEYYSGLGESLGFTIRKNTPVIKHGVNLGKVDVFWVEPNIVFSCEFGNFDEILKHLWRIKELRPEMAVLLLSSGSQCRPDNVKKIVENSDLLKDARNNFLILDLKEERIIYKS